MLSVVSQQPLGDRLGAPLTEHHLSLRVTELVAPDCVAP